MYEVIRLFFGVIVFLVCVLLIGKFAGIRKQHAYRISIIVALFLPSLLYPVSVENYFVTFSSPEAAFHYMNADKAELVVEGEESAWVIGEDVTDMISKSDTGWKLSVSEGAEMISHGISPKETVFYVDQYEDTDDYYVTVLAPEWGSAGVTDNRNSQFYYLTDDDEILDTTYYTYYAYVHDLDDEYVLIVNGEVIPVLDRQD